MMDLDECVEYVRNTLVRGMLTVLGFIRCMRALYFNPFPLIILDADQHVRMMNWPAETVRQTPNV